MTVWNFKWPFEISNAHLKLQKIIWMQLLHEQNAVKHEHNLEIFERMNKQTEILACQTKWSESLNRTNKCYEPLKWTNKWNENAKWMNERCEWFKQTHKPNEWNA